MRISLAMLAMASLLLVVIGCNRVPTLTIDSDKSIQLIANIPNTIPLPKKVEIYSTGKDHARDSFRAFSKNGGNSDLIFESTSESDISSLVSALRNEATEGIPRITTKIGRSYHILLYDSTSQAAFYFIGFVPSRTNERPYIVVNSAASYVCPADSLMKWLSAKGL